METQTRYDLNAAIESWRQELAAQPNLTAEVRRELETHLRDAIAGFQQRGLNDEESFWLACKRVGQPPQLGEEFVKADPAKIWRERLFWMAVGIWIVGILTYIIIPTEGNLWFLIFSPHLDRDQNFFFEAYFPQIFIAHLIVLAILFSRGFVARFAPLIWVFQNRLRLTTVFCISAWIGCFQTMGLIDQIRANRGEILWSYIGLTTQAWNVLVYYKSLFLGLLIVLVWLLPPQNRKTPKCA